MVKVIDENGVAVAWARVMLVQAETQNALKRETDYAGRAEFRDLPSGIYELRVEKEGFYVVTLDRVRPGEAEIFEVTLNHQQEFVEVVNVVSSPPAIDPNQTSNNEKLSNQDLINLPYTTTRDVRYALGFLPGVLQDATGQLHVSGSSTYQILDQLDGFNITHPVSGTFDLRVSLDALRLAEVQSSRYSAEYGKGSGGVIALETGMGDDRYRFSATDFVPSVQKRKGALNFNTWTPRATFSGPLAKGRAWFLDALEGEYDLTIINELPSGADRNPLWRLGNLAKAQVNLNPANILTTSFLINRVRSEHAGLSRFTPLETTTHLKEAAYLFSVKNQSHFSNGMLLEVGMGVVQFNSDDRPLGRLTYVIRPEGTSGNFFRTFDARTRRLQWIGNLFLPAARWHGRHELKLGTDIDRVTYHQFAERRPFLIFRQDATLSRMVTFADRTEFQKSNVEVGAYAQDRWSRSDRLLAESGVRFDWDQILRRALVSPRFASTYLLTRDGNTKLAAGVGIFRDATNLSFITRPLSGRRFDYFYDRRGQAVVRPPVETIFQVNERALKGPRFLNWSISLEHKLPASIYLRAEFLQKRGRHGFTFVNRIVDPSNPFSGLFELRNERRDRYDAFNLSLHRRFKGNYSLFASYTRSRARSSAVLSFNIDNPLFSLQAGGPLPWDTPNRILSWGWLPLVKGFDLAYALDWHDGFPFGLVNQDQQLVGPPGSRRFPTYFALNLHIERRFRLFGFLWALRGGFDDLTDRHNPGYVNNNVDSPEFLTFGGLQGRSLTGRIRLLGRK